MGPHYDNEDKGHLLKRMNGPPSEVPPNICYYISLARALFQGHHMQHKRQGGLRFCFVFKPSVLPPLTK